MGKPKGRKADFQKVKLKIGRRLPKGLNVTDTSFKSKKIVLRDQLLKEASDGSTSRKRGIKELLSRLQHYHPGTRHESLQALKELLTTTPTLIQNNFSVLIERVCVLLVDKEQPVRKAVHLLLTEVFKHISPDFISPFFPIITSYLCCAMTHILSDVQHDSLKVLDLLLDVFPHLTVMSPSKILNNFLNQISSNKEGKKGHILLVKPGEKLTSQKWRMEVLHRVQQFLEVLLETWDSKMEEKMSCQENVLSWDGTGQFSVGLFKHGLEPVIANSFSFYNWKQEKVPTKSLDQAQAFIRVLFPLMVDIWLEASPEKHSDDIGSFLTRDASDVLECVLQVIWSLVQWLDKLTSGDAKKKSQNTDWLEDVFYKDFEHFFLRDFPYSPMETTLKNRKKKHGLPQAPLTSHNLLICEVFFCIKPVIDERTVAPYEEIVDYLLYILTSEAVREESNIVATVRIIQKVALNNVHHEYTQELLKKLWILYKRWPSSPNDCQPIENFYMEIVSSQHYKELVQTKSLQTWLEQLPKDLLNSGENPEQMMELLERCDQITSCRYPLFIQSLLSLEPQIIELLCDLPFEEEDLFKAQRHLLNIVCNMPTISEEVFRTLAQVLRNPTIDIRNVDYLLQNINFRFQTQDDPGFNAAHYLSLILSIQFGVVSKEAEEIEEDFQSSENGIHLQHFTPQISAFVVVPVDYQVMERHQQISAKIVRYIFDFPETIDVQKAILSYVMRILDKFHYIPAHAVAGIFSLVLPFLREGDTDEGDYSESSSQLRFRLFELTLAAISTSCALTILSRMKQSCDPRMDEIILDVATEFIADTECIEPVCKVLERNVSCLKGVSETQGECLGLILSKLMRFDEPEGGSLNSMAKLLGMIQVLTEGHMSRSKWLNPIVYDFKMKAQMSADM